MLLNIKTESKKYYQLPTKKMELNMKQKISVKILQQIFNRKSTKVYLLQRW